MVNTVNHSRSRRAAVFGLILQTAATIGVVALATAMRSIGLAALVWHLAGGIVIWFAAVLVFRQRELASLEALDLDELRREKALTGGGEAMFGGASGGTGFLVAKSRLEWMERWLVPTFGLIAAAYLAIAGVLNFISFREVIVGLERNPLPPMQNVEIGLVALSILTLALFFCCRYATGLARVAEWQLLRACGTYMFGNTLAALAMVLAVGARLYQGIDSWEHYVALATLSLMVLLGAETLLNFVLDIYRPRSPGTERRAAFDSRMLGLISEPTGIARSLAEAVNYQFGFQVSQTWFYQLLSRTLIPLVGVGAAAVWGLSCVVIVDPHEHALIERFGRQISPDAPLGPGVHFKLPYPFDVSRKFSTGVVHQFRVGYKVGDQPLPQKRDLAKPIDVELWTDDEHSGRQHFNFIVCPASRETAPAASAPAAGAGADKRAVNLIRLEAFVQYRIRPDRLGEYTVQNRDPDELLRSVAWSETTRLTSAMRVDDLLGPQRERFDRELFERISRRCEELRLGVELVEVGLLNVHPEKSVATAYRSVITAQQERVAEIRKARVEEDRLLSQVAGNRARALALSRAIEFAHAAEVRRAIAEETLRLDSRRLSEEMRTRLESLAPQHLGKLEADLALQRAVESRDRVREEYALAMGRTSAEVAAAENAVARAREAQSASDAALESAQKPVRDLLARALSESEAQAVLNAAAARFAVEFWYRDLERNLTGLEGEAAVKLAEAQATRWNVELRAAAELTRVENERTAYRAAPRVYLSRMYWRALSEGMAASRKYFYAFDAGHRKVNTWLNTEEQARPDLTTITPPKKD